MATESGFASKVFPAEKKENIVTPIWLWRRDVLVQEVQPDFCLWSHIIIRCTVRQ